MTMTSAAATPSFDWIAHHATNRPNARASIDLATGREFTYAQMNDRTSRLAHALSTEFGVGHGDRVAVLANNNTNSFEVQFACWKLGAIFVPLNWRLTIPELVFIVGDAAPTVMVHDNEFADTAATLAVTPGIAHLMCWDPVEPSSAGKVADYEELLRTVEPLPTPVRTTHDDVLTIMYTSGTTGRPKGAMITQGMVLWNAINVLEFYQLSTSMVNFAFLPLFHTGGLNTFSNPSFHMGGSTIVMKTFDPAEALRLLTDPDMGITHLLGVPANFLFMSQVPAFAEATFPTIVAAGVGGSPTPVPLIETWKKKGLALQQAFGMTETSPLVLALGPEDALTKIGSAGLPAMHNEVRIVDDEGNDVVQGETGELWVRGPNVTPGYWNRPEANIESFTDGWLHTGDLCAMDERGYCTVEGRLKDMIIRGGENIYPRELEDLLFARDDVAEVAVVGLPDDRFGEVVGAFIRPAPGTELDKAALFAHLREHLAPHKTPAHWFSLDEFPLTGSGKIQKFKLRDDWTKGEFESL